MTFKDVLEVRTKNIQASRSRTDQFVASVSASYAFPCERATVKKRTTHATYNPYRPQRHKLTYAA